MYRKIGRFMKFNENVTSVKTLQEINLSTFTGAVLFVDLSIDPTLYSECKDILYQLTNLNCKYYVLDFSEVLTDYIDILSDLNVDTLPSLIVVNNGKRISQFTLPVPNIQNLLDVLGEGHRND